ncbi:Jag family protein [Pseudanabaena sp. Chao 1811]|uniref:Jag family protein n=1 Tax=Pseudanabaena sp. Chao 1811 TaxID=2963092 RepID=UPI0022F3EF14|nr:R3H domain-containing nucleic acid-binding protein [Pseudanabaena sp. Chao 1811]
MQDASASANWLQELLSLMGYSASVNTHLLEASPEQAASNSKNYWLEISTDGLQEQQIQKLIGQDGVVIDSLQYLANTVLNSHLPSNLNQSSSHPQNHNFYTVELNGYRSKYLANLNDLAEKAVQQVRETQTEFAIKNLSSADRRYIHQFLESFPDIQTYSQGKEPNRHLIVKLVQI